MTRTKGRIVRISKELDDIMREKALCEKKSITQASQDIAREYRYLREKETKLKEELNKLLRFGGDLKLFK